MELMAELLQYAVNLLDDALGRVCPNVGRGDLLEEDASLWVTEQLRAQNLWPSEGFASLYTVPQLQVHAVGLGSNQRHRKRAAGASKS